MRTSLRPRRRPAILASVLLAATLGVLLTAASIARGMEPDLVATLAEGGVTVRPVTTTGFITREQALAVADEVQEEAFKAGDRDAALVSATDPMTIRGDNPVADRAVWIVRYTGLAIPVGGPIRENGTAADGGVFTTAYIYIDAISGDWLLTKLEG